MARSCEACRSGRMDCRGQRPGDDVLTLTLVVWRAEVAAEPSADVWSSIVMPPRPVPRIGMPALNLGCGRACADLACFHQMKTNMVWPSSSGTQPRACMWLKNSPLGACDQQGNRKLAKRQ